MREPVKPGQRTTLLNIGYKEGQIIAMSCSQAHRIIGDHYKELERQRLEEELKREEDELEDVRKAFDYLEELVGDEGYEHINNIRRYKMKGDL